MDNTIMTTKGMHGFINKFWTIVRAQTTDFEPRLPFKHSKNITDSNASVFLSVWESSYRVSTANFDHYKGIEETIPGRDRHRTSEVYHNKFHFGVISVAGLREEKTMGFGIYTTTANVVELSRYAYFKTID